MANTAEAPRTLSAKQKEIVIVRAFDLPVQLVWQAWTEPQSLKKWWGPANFTCTFSEIDLRPGGKYLHCMRSALGEKIWSTGTYNEIEPNKKLVFTDSFSDNKGHMIPAADLDIPGKWPMILLISLCFDQVGNGCNLVITHEGIPSEIAEDCIRGWNQSLDKLEAAMKVTLQ
jgi:uncharacterized protein YndB with AHSA1/START domain